MNFKAMRYETTSFNRIVADKSHHVTLAQDCVTRLNIKKLSKCLPCGIGKLGVSKKYTKLIKPDLKSIS